MKKLGKLDLKQVEMKDDEMKVLFGGKLIYKCIRACDYGEDGIRVYTFTTDNFSLANSWCGFWESAGWATKIYVDDDGSNKGMHYYYL
ncbi:TIGR04149 family rSAM-modified RiPP [uncultured Bacteroides sp.]|uniref:TIGR04149 family rSAM-modified RiPP n=1 Tax=uncultured Bacteroides sp. TaxID=162156 RepID=UPI0025FC9C0D|nr:TIGR04149 family rSAM-modified RiPP [uncultured Bacteroides sp.]